MSLIATKGGNGGSMKPIEAGTHMAVCYGLIDLGHQYNEKYGKSTHKCLVMFEVLDEQMTTKEGEEINRSISSTYTMSLNEKSTLYKDLIAWRGKPFTDDELKGFDLRNIVGAPCMLSIVHTERNGNTYANIASIMKMPKNMAGMVVRTIEDTVFDLDKNEMSAMASLPSWIQERIQNSDEYKDWVAGQGAGAEADITEGGQPAGVFTDLDDSEGELPF